MSEEKHAALDRRTMLAMTAAAITGGVAGCARGAAPTYTTATQTNSRRRFENKVVLVTGATSGIGRAAAIAFAAEGAKVAFCGRRETLGQEVERGIKSQGGEAVYIRADVRDESSVRSLVDRVVQRYGRLDIAFNNAGITLEKPLHEYSASADSLVLSSPLRLTMWIGVSASTHSFLEPPIPRW
ncbi:SDR family NAD(P)-dependent oxidoreductase [Terriglobus sp. YAF25]|uniref:SDR family NAD(P)-dependent oxidoreductase n=1 Tax=Terriglobus sp. YAF25 TaxID=3233080 RepID=UPI003F9DEE3E